MKTVPEGKTSGNGTPSATAARAVPPGKPPRAALTMAEDDESRDPEEVLVTTYANGEFTEARMSLRQAVALDASDVDYHRDEICGRITIKTGNGTCLEYFGDIPGGGEVTGAFLEELMWQPGRLLGWPKLTKNRRLKSFSSTNAMAARLAALRRAFGETASDPWYFLTRRRGYSVAWNADRSWRLIETLAVGDGRDGQETEDMKRCAF